MCSSDLAGPRPTFGATHVLISPAYAQAAASGGSESLLATMLPMVAIFAIFYFLMIRPQQKKQKEHRAMIDALEKGNEVVTAGGIVGRVSKVEDQYVGVEIASGVEIRVQRHAISQLLPKGTLKSL